MSHRYRVPLPGCRPAPLAGYLKAQAVLRLLATHGAEGDTGARGQWENGHFVIISRLDREALLDFFLNRYRPTPILSPWNGGSGFHPKDNQTALLAIEQSQEPRLAPYRAAIAAARAVLAEMGLGGKPDAEQKPELLRRCRATFPEAALPWLDAVTVLTADRPNFMPLLGTGGNDGRLDFSNNFMQQLLHCLDPAAGPGRRHNLEQVLFGAAEGDLAYTAASLGQFLPGGVGGPNASTGFSGDSVVNPWDYVLAMEGSLCFAGAVSRRFGSHAQGKAAFPFTVDASVAASTGLAEADTAGARAEVWLPLWERPVSWPELDYVLGEGRAQWGRRQARTGLDFAEAAVNLGVDRGITAFQRMALLLRNGRSFLAVALDQVAVRQFPGSDLLRDPALTYWVEQFGRLATGSGTPEAWRRAYRQLEQALYLYCLRGAAAGAAPDPREVQGVLVALAQAEQVVARSRPEQRRHLPPLGSLDSRWWQHAADNSPEWAVASALAGLQPQGAVGGLRPHLEPVAPLAPVAAESRIRPRWEWADTSGTAIWSAQLPLTQNMSQVLWQRCLLAEEHDLPAVPLDSSRPAGLETVYQFLNGLVDDRRIAALTQALSLVDLRPQALPPQSGAGTVQAPPDLPRLYALLSLLFRLQSLVDRTPAEPGAAVALLPNRAILQRLRGGDLDGAAQLALRQFRGRQIPTRLPIRHQGWLLPEGIRRRLPAALLIPVADPPGTLRDWILAETSTSA